MSKCPFHTREIVDGINELDGCPSRLSRIPVTARPPEALTPLEAKGEYYSLLTDTLPGIVEITREFRGNFPHGFVEYSPGTNSVVPAITSVERRISAEPQDFSNASYQVHDAIIRTIDIATEEWLRRGASTNPDFPRLTDLTDPKRKLAFGPLAAQKRISSAMAQTAHISGSFQRFIDRIIQRKTGVRPNGHEMAMIHDRSSVTAAKLTELHLLRTRPVREVLGSESHNDGLVHLYTDDSPFDIIDDRIELVDPRFVEIMGTMPVDTSDGRIGCPGKRYIPEIWDWISQASHEYSFPLLKR